MIVNRQELADILGVTPPTVDARVAKGLPYKTKGKEGKSYEFDTKEVVDWITEQEKKKVSKEFERGDSIGEAKRRKLNAEADKAEIELAKEIGLVVMVEDVMPSFNEAISNLRSQLFNLPRRLTPQLLGETDEQSVKKTLDCEVRKLLEEVYVQAKLDISRELVKHKT